ncbi:Prodigiosin synthesizing transferase PigC, partial [Araneus ventricosus]
MHPSFALRESAMPDLTEFERGMIVGSRLVGGSVTETINDTRNIQKLPKGTLLPEISYPSPSVVPLFVPFSEKVCQNPDITGGKGSSLGKLTELSKDFKNFIVPNGVVVTTAAYEVFVTDEILKEIKKLEKVL